MISIELTVYTNLCICIYEGNGGVLQRPARDYQQINERLRKNSKNSDDDDDDVVLNDDCSDINESDDNESSVIIDDDDDDEEEAVASNVTVGDVNRYKFNSK